MPRNFTKYDFGDLLKSVDSQPQYFTTKTKVVDYKSRWRMRKIKKIKSKI